MNLAAPVNRCPRALGCCRIRALGNYATPQQGTGKHLLRWIKAFFADDPKRQPERQPKRGLYRKRNALCFAACGPARLSVRFRRKLRRIPQQRALSMTYVATNYANNPRAPVGQWTCSPTSSLKPSSEVPPEKSTKGPDLCGQCVSYVKKVCPSLPQTTLWKKGSAVRGNKSILPGTVIATFNKSGKYVGHAAIFVREGVAGIDVYDQYVTLPSPKAVGPRTLRWGAHGNANNGDNFYVVE